MPSPMDVPADAPVDAAALPPRPVEPPPGCPFEPPVDLARLRTEAPVSRIALADGNRAWLITRYADIRAVLGDHARFSSDPSRPGFPRSGMAGDATAEGRAFIRTDPPEHTRLRRMVTREFMVKRVDALRPRIQELTDELCDAMAGTERSAHPVDLVRALALPLPSRVIGLLLGVPEEDHPLFQNLTATLLSRTATDRERGTARRELVAYLDSLVTAKEKAPADDILGRLITERQADGKPTHRELIGCAGLLLVAGHETTANMIGLGALTLMRDGAAAERLRQDPALLPGAVEELLRFHSIIRSGPRRAVLEDVEIGGRLLRAGEGVVCALASANRDPETFEDPGTFDVSRARAQRHVAFGYGIHQCLGQALARAELQIVLGTLLRRFPTMRPAVPLDEIPFRTDMAIYGCHTLPVTW
ncbi:cytochrome P450 [Streptomyces pinistramenti]|uniref:cytochrome P450 n=1 Tax=Streptomyces pinistramenti TaxID=2884812 RepID=UPI001D094C61|nr:cytochrome P450 [Streptomyces pinistramenti]MCB5911568.1 cytochrome P450 [Streptomyces pinistramenti]